MASALLRPTALAATMLVVAGSLIFAAAPAYAADHPVSDYAELETAINAAVDGDTITFGASIIATDDLPTILDDITIRGGGFTFDGGAAHPGFTVFGASVTIENLTVTNTGGFHSFYPGPGSSLTLESITADGGIFALDSDLTIRDSVFTEGESEIDGTGIAVLIERTSFNEISSGDGIEINVTDGTVTLTDVTASRNAADGVDVDVDGDSTFTATRLVLIDNDSSGLESEVTGGATATITQSTANENYDSGFMLFAEADSEIDISDSSASQNFDDGFATEVEAGGTIRAVRLVASGNDDDGFEAQFVDGGSVDIADSTFDANGYGVYLDDSGGDAFTAELTVRNSTVSNNLSFGVLGYPYVDGSILVRNSTISGNGSDGGSGILLGGEGALTISHTTITNNGYVGQGGDDDGEPGGFGVELRDEVNASIVHSIIAGNLGEYDVDVVDDATLTIDYSLIGAASPAAAPAVTTGTGNLSGVDPQLGPLADNGGPTLTHLPASGSPAVDAGNPAIVGAPSFDQRGVGYLRIQLGRIDMGSVERQAALASTGTESGPLGLAALALLLAGAVFSGGALLRKRDA